MIPHGSIFFCGLNRGWSESGHAYQLYQIEAEWSWNALGESAGGTGSHLDWRVPVSDGFFGYLGASASDE